MILIYLDNNSGIHEISTSLLYYSCNLCNLRYLPFTKHSVQPQTDCHRPGQRLVAKLQVSLGAPWPWGFGRVPGTFFFSRYSWPRKGTLNITKHRFNNRFIYTKQRWSTLTINSWQLEFERRSQIPSLQKWQAPLAELYPDHPKTTVEAPERCQGLQITASWILMILLMEEILHQLIW